MDAVNLAVILFLVSLFSLSTLVLLARQNYDTIPADSAFRDAATTVFILSTLFCTLNACYVINPIRCVISDKLMTESDVCNGTTLFYWLTTWIALPLNSALNPIVYFARSRNMRQFFSMSVRRMTKRRRGGSQGYSVCGTESNQTFVTKGHTTATV